MRIRETFVAHDILDACLGWQEIINMEGTPEGKDAAATQAAHSLKNTGLRGTRKIIASSEVALLFDDRSPGDEADTGAKYRDVVLAGWLGLVTKLNLAGHVTLALPIYDASVFDFRALTERPSTDNPLLSPRGQLVKPLHLPIESINFAICAPDALRV